MLHHPSLVAQELWGEIMLLIAEDREGLPPPGTSRKLRAATADANAAVRRGRGASRLSGGGHATAAALTDGQPSPAAAGPGLITTTVQQQVERYQDAGICAVPLDFAPHAAVGLMGHHAEALRSHLGSIQVRDGHDRGFTSLFLINQALQCGQLFIPLLQPDARYCDPLMEAVAGTAPVSDVMGAYAAGEGIITGPSPSRTAVTPAHALHPFRRPVDASALKRQHEVMAACVAQLREVFAAEGLAPLPPSTSRATDGSAGPSISRAPDARYVSFLLIT